VKPAAFDYQAPETLPDALSLLASAGESAMPLAGGQSLVPLLSTRRCRPATVIDLNRLPGLDGVSITRDSVRVGAMTRLRTLERHAGLRQALPVLPQTAALVGQPQIRHRATLGGSLCHADPAAELPALAVALEAGLRLRSRDGERTEAAARFFTGPHATARQPGELLTEIEFPLLPGFRFWFEEVTQRGDAGFPVVGLCLGISLHGPVVTGARLAAAGVAPWPLRLTTAEARLTGRRIDDDLSDVAEAAVADTDPLTDLHGDVRYRQALLRVLIRRAASHAANMRSSA
jgi:aerobic carbon-monoxide dehydrogenase medium subunit